MTENPTLADRRAFLKAGTIAAAASALPSVLNAQVAGSAEIKIALVGCGGRGSGAANQALNVPGNKLVAVADAFQDRLTGSLENLKKELSGNDLVSVIDNGNLVGFPHLLGYKVSKNYSEIMMTHGGNPVS